MDGRPQALLRANNKNCNVTAKKSRVIFSYKVHALVYFLGFFCIGMSLWTQRFFGRVSVDQALWTISFGTQGVLAADSVFIRRFISWALIGPMIVTLLFLGLEYMLSYKNTKIKMLSYLSYLILAIGLIYFGYQFNIIKYLIMSHKPEKDQFALNYHDTNKVNFQVYQPKNLVLIYVESLEESYSHTEIFGHDLLAQLNIFKKNNLTFSRYRQVTGTSWTMGGIVSTQCGIPLKALTILGNNRVGENINHFLPNVKCLGDILAEHGYKNVFMEGSSLDVGGKGKFLENHHYAERYGKDDWLRHGYTQADMNHWGLPDDELFVQAKYKLNQLMKQNQLFNLTLLTVDTHGVKGQLNKTCEAKGYHGFEGVVECSANLVADFVNYIMSQGWQDKINIVIFGDHLAMSNDVSDKLETNKLRTIFNVIISDKKFQKNTDEIVHFDMLPTILDTLGFVYEDHKLGLGYSAIYRNNTFAENRLKHIEEQVSYDSERYNQLWLPNIA